jgi:hypothetical protein
LPSLQYGAPAWLEQHDALQQLNLQAHLNAQTHSDEFVKEALVSHDKLSLLVRELLAAEVGAERSEPPKGETGSASVSSKGADGCLC